MSFILTKPPQNLRTGISSYGHYQRRNKKDAEVIEGTDYGNLPCGVAHAIDSLLQLTTNEVELALEISRGRREIWCSVPFMDDARHAEPDRPSPPLDDPPPPEATPAEENA